MMIVDRTLQRYARTRGMARMILAIAAGWRTCGAMAEQAKVSVRSAQRLVCRLEAAGLLRRRMVPTRSGLSSVLLPGRGKRWKKLFFLAVLAVEKPVRKPR